MTKLAWVLVPLALAALWAAWLAWQGRLPSRPVLNAWSSLLLVYVGATAALGIFWVANQHLPVFDWHYLFGYATLLLLALHLAVNARQWWAHLRVRRAAPPLAERRRSLTGVLTFAGLASATGVAYWIGLRHGRSVLRVAHDGAAGQGVGWSVIEAFHRHSSHSRAGLLQRAPSARWAPPPPFKSQFDRPLHALPAPWRAAPHSGPSLDVHALATLLWHAAGITASRGGLALRAAPSSGALFATELYVAARRIGDLPAGLWHYEVQQGGLSRLNDASASWFDAQLPPDAAGAIVATAVFRRSGHKHGDRTYRYVLADLRHLLENLRASAEALGLPLRFAGAFDEAQLAQALRIDETEEGVLALVALDEPGSARTDAATAAATASASTPSRTWSPGVPTSTSAAKAQDLTHAVHRATSLRSAPAAAASAPTLAEPMPRGALLELHRAASAAYDPLPVIAARRSVRRYRGQPVPLQVLSELLAAARRPGPVLSGAIGVHLVSHAVDGLAEAAWRYDADRHALRASTTAAPMRRARTRAAALDQEAAGDATIVFVLTLALAAQGDDPAGVARAYRHAFLEAGTLGERLYLQAGALGLGVCAVGAFYDGEAAALIGVDPAREWPLHFVTVGWPA